MDETKARLTDLVTRPKDRFMYPYDYGDNWEHIIELVDIKEPQPDVKYPVCLAGERACPPEDCGGPWSYPDFVKTMQGKNTKQRREFIEWLGYEFDPEEFDIEEVNKVLRGIRGKERCIQLFTQPAQLPPWPSGGPAQRRPR